MYEMRSVYKHIIVLTSRDNMIVRVIMITITLDNDELAPCYWPILD